MLECLDRILIPACTHLTMGLKQKQPALMAILMQACVHALLHVPRLSPHPAHRFVMSRRPRQVGACRVFFFPQSESVFTATRARLLVTSSLLRFLRSAPTAGRLKPGVVRKQHSPANPPSRKQSASQLQLFFLIRRCETCCLALRVFAPSSQKTI